MNLVVFKDVFLKLGTQTILKEISVAFQKDQLITIIGPNGSGKSSLIKLILGIFKPTKGRVFIKKGLRIGYMPQRIEITPFMPLTVKRFLSDISLLEQVGCPEISDYDMSTLSGGQMQRVLLAKALANKPDLLILDEPTRGLDVNGESLFYKLILDYQKQTHCGVILVSHDLNFVLKQTQKVVCLNHHICCIGTPDKVSDNVRQLFEKVPYTHHHNHEHNLEGEICEFSEHNQ